MRCRRRGLGTTLMRTTAPFVLLALAFTVMAFPGCATLRQEQVKNKETLLVAAGFKIMAADNPTRQAQLAAMPPLKMVRWTMQDGSLIYTYANPKGCNCIYLGKPKNYEEYRRLVMAQQVAGEEDIASTEAEDLGLNMGTLTPFGWAD